MKLEESETKEQRGSPFLLGREPPRTQKVVLIRLSQKEEAELVQQASQGDQEAFFELCEHCTVSIYSYFFQRVRNTDLARTLTIETMREAQALMNREQWHSLLFEKWLSLIARKVFGKWLREKAPEPSLKHVLQLDKSTGEFANTRDVLPAATGEGALWQLVKNLSLAQPQ